MSVDLLVCVFDLLWSNLEPEIRVRVRAVHGFVQSTNQHFIFWLGFFNFHLWVIKSYRMTLNILYIPELEKKKELM